MGAVVEDSASEHEDSDLPCNISLEEGLGGCECEVFNSADVF